MSRHPSFIWNLLRSEAAQRLTGADSAHTWDAMKSAYDHTRSGSFRVEEDQQSDPDYRLSRLCFRKRDGHSIAGLLLRPASPDPCPCVVLLHALSSDKETMIRHFGRALAARGVASLALDAHLHGERRADSSERLHPLQYLDLARETIIEYRLALDQLACRSDLIPGRFGLLGYSLGAMMGTILAAVDTRIAAAALLVGGDVVRNYQDHLPSAVHGLLRNVTPSNFAPHISPRPVLFINGRRDTTVSHQAAEMLHEAAQEPKEIVWADAGHLLPPEIAERGVQWLVDHLR